ncbi:hypothetical protein GOP47_0024561 [Adiantum capillus-veneris]|uniref:GTD-binding domain-containing protein n=1 Tax=Adiantum capillus-veneris TaxID=13818 RepID=A0A9D4U1Z3_ADICA|nr:hypothetical protein GOP47_0024561 [Adiantum capillus-veneris]
MQLCLTVLVLVHTVILCITCQLMRWYGWGCPSCHGGISQRGATLSYNSGVFKKPFNLDSNGSRRTPLISTEKILKRSRSDDRRAVKSRSFVCPKCYGMWNLKQGLSFRYDKGATSQLRETPAPSDADNSPPTLVEARTCSNVECGPRASSIGEKLASCQNSSFECAGSILKFLNSELAGKACNGADEAGHGRVHFQSASFNEDNCDTESCSNTPVHALPRVGKDVAAESDVCREAPGEEVASSSKQPRGHGLSNDSAVNLQSAELIPSVQKEIQEEILDEGFAAVPRKEGDNKEGSYESVIKGLWGEPISAFKDVKKGYDSESVIKGLKEAVLRERKKLCTLYAELEIERISSETAANEAMSMISRLQEEKAKLRMQSAHYRRIAEERAIYDEQAMELLKDILVKKEKENFLLEEEVKAMRTRCCRNGRIHGKKRQGLDTPECQGTLFLKNEGDSDGMHLPDRKSEGTAGELPSLPPRSEKQPFKRLKGNTDHGNLSSRRTFLASEVHLNTQMALSGGIETHVFGPYCSCEHDYSATTTKKDCEEVFDNGLVAQEKATSSEVVEEDIAKKANEKTQFGVCSSTERETFCLDSGVTLGLNTLEPCSSDEVSSNLPACTEETRVLASTDVLQLRNMVLHCNTRKDLQTTGHISQVDRLPQSCPSSLNLKGSVFNNFGESDSSLMRSHVH